MHENSREEEPISTQDEESIGLHAHTNAMYPVLFHFSIFQFSSHI